MTTVVGGTQSVPVASAAPAPAGAIADPAPLGLAAFGFTTLLLSAINANWIEATSLPIVLALAIPFGGASQVFAGMWEFRRGNTFAATAFTSYGAFWISFVLIFTLFNKGLPADATPIVGLYLFAWGVFTAYMFIASLAGLRAVSVVFILLALTFFALAIGEWGKSPTPPSTFGWHQIGGYLGLLTALAAVYTSFAEVTNANFKRKILPV